MSQTILVIGYGNDLRSDDAVGQRVAQMIAVWNLSNVRFLWRTGYYSSSW